jgi:hypothetical protein
MTSKWAVVAGIIVMTVVVVIASALSAALRERADKETSADAAQRLRFWGRLLGAASSAAPLVFIASLSSDGMRDILAGPDRTLLFMFGTVAIVGALIAGVIHARKTPDRYTATRRAVAFFVFSLLSLFVLFALPLGALVWAAVETAPGYTPEGLIGEIRRNARYPAAELRQLAADPPIDPAAVMARLREVLDEAEKFVAAMPSDKAGLIFLRAGRPVQPDPALLDAHTTHAARRRGHWPSSPDITAAMLAHLQTPKL